MKVADLLSTDLGARLRLAVIAPVAIPLVIGAGLALSGAPELPPNVPRFLDTLRSVKTAEIAAAVAILVIFCVLAAPLQLPLIRFLEGYWGDGWVARWLSRIGRRRQMRRMRELRAASQMLLDEPDAKVTDEDIVRISRAAELLRQRFPAETEMLPTALGNALRAAERRAGDRYGLDAVVLWPRLHVVMPSNTRTAVNSARDQLDLLAGLTVSFVVAALVALVFTAQHNWWLGLPLVLLSLAALAYRGTVASAIHYGMMVAVAFDLHRFELLAALHVPLPSDGATERSLYAPLEKVLRGIPDAATGALPNLTYSHPEPTKTSAARPANGGGGRNAPEKNASGEGAETEAEADDAASEQARPADEADLESEPGRG